MQIRSETAAENAKIAHVTTIEKSDQRKSDVREERRLQTPPPRVERADAHRPTVGTRLNVKA